MHRAKQGVDNRSHAYCFLYCNMANSCDTIFVESRMSKKVETPSRRPRPEPRATITVQLPFDLDIELEDRAIALGIKKRDIIVRGIEMALKSAEFKNH